MPTGYTAKVQKGISFEEYALGCSRAFGALVMMRDEASDKEIPESFKPSDYHLKAKNKAESELARLKSLCGSEASDEALGEFNSSEAYRIEKLDEEVVIESRYSEMLCKAKSYNSPSEEHDKFKEFMISQLEESIKFDCGGDYYKKPTERKTGAQWRSEKIEKAHTDIAYHIKHYRDEVNRTDDRNKWVGLLRNSLKAE